MVTLSQALRLVGEYARDRVSAQARAVAPLVLYLILFQVLVLGIPVAEAGVIATGLLLVVAGLALFMEGLLLGLMPLGETIGLKLPQRAPLALILVFAFLLGLGSTFAEPAIGVLRAAGASIRPWEAPLLFLLLNPYADWLVYSVGIGVGVAVAFGMLRFLYRWSLKPFIYALVGAALILTLWCHLDPNLVYVVGLAWDCGGVTTGPVTVPLVLALGIGVSRVVDCCSGDAQGFGVVTLASLFPVLAVLVLGVALAGRAPAPLPEAEFFAPTQRAQATALFGDAERVVGYGLQHGSAAAQAALFGGDATALGKQLAAYAADPALAARAFGGREALLDWLASRADPAQRGLFAAAGWTLPQDGAVRGGASLLSRVVPNVLAALQAILPLTLFLFVVLKWLLRFRFAHVDEVVLGVAFALAGMSLFNLGIEMGIARLGAQVGDKLPSAYTTIALPQERGEIADFDPTLVHRALGADGTPVEFFFAERGQTLTPVRYDPAGYDAATGHYHHIPRLGPLFGGDLGPAVGIALVLLFAFVLGYAATLAEPALNALGLTVEKVTGGGFHKGLLIQSVAVGVGAGLLLGVVKVVWDLPLAWLIVPPYLALLLLTRASGEELVNIAWDSAGVTTGPVTVPLVLALGLGIGGQAGVVEGFGILGMASVCPVITVLGIGLYVTARHKRELALAVPPSVAGLEPENRTT